MTDWSAIFLGIIALSVSVMAAIQVGIVVYGARLARRVDALANQVDREIKPLLTHLERHRRGGGARDDAGGGAGRARRPPLCRRQPARRGNRAPPSRSAIVAPAREGLALLTGVRAAFDAFKGMRQADTPAHPSAPDEDDPLFIG